MSKYSAIIATGPLGIDRNEIIAYKTVLISLGLDLIKNHSNLLPNFK